MTMGQKIKMYRTRLGMSQKELGAMVGVNKAAVQKWERGTVENIKRSNIKFLADLFGIAPSDLMCWGEQSHTENRLWDESSLIDRIQISYGKRSAELIMLFGELNEHGQKKILENMSDLVLIPKYTNSSLIVSHEEPFSSSRIM